MPQRAARNQQAASHPVHLFQPLQVGKGGLGVWKPQALQVSWKRQGLGALVATAADPSGNPDRLLVFTDSTSNNIIKTTCRRPISSRYHWLDPEKLEAARKEFAEMEA